MNGFNVVACVAMSKRITAVKDNSSLFNILDLQSHGTWPNTELNETAKIIETIGSEVVTVPFYQGVHQTSWEVSLDSLE